MRLAPREGEMGMRLWKVLLACLLCATLCLPAGLAESGMKNAGYAETPVVNASISQLTNIYLAATAIDGYELEYGDRFSFNEVVGPRSAENGYQIGVNGRGARVRGGGVSQVATTLLMAVMDLDWVTVEDYTTYGDKFTGGYVDDSSLAVVTDYAAG